ncbi:unnamed protein product [Tilletia laevis]|uniref:FHA domain-containing protein n=2 Tax=Tilletia TaxID=13289 RepID=A0A177TZR0_9BASI|nr:hypothetical protein CF336_g9124 [Tilletia laevis]KAE8240550.1 hypothetical protein A4X03_0g8491 [Tilletia caries]KAE8181599.1 hypothetical protein CF335_g8880 [Tilletia laevis]CAD6885188.1 unnamed protein product [Tilletia caries]CAD6901584.1 unnamed protein product [Tilletia laevis]
MGRSFYFHLHLIPLTGRTDGPTTSWPADDSGHFFIEPSSSPAAPSTSELPSKQVRISFCAGSFTLHDSGDRSTTRVNGRFLAAGACRVLVQNDIVELACTETSSSSSFRPALSCRVDLLTSSSPSLELPGPYTFSSSQHGPRYAQPHDRSRSLDDMARHFKLSSSPSPSRPALFTFSACTVTTSPLLRSMSSGPDPSTSGPTCASSVSFRYGDFIDATRVIAGSSSSSIAPPDTSPSTRCAAISPRVPAGVVDSDSTNTPVVVASSLPTSSTTTTPDSSTDHYIATPDTTTTSPLTTDASEGACASTLSSLSPSSTSVLTSGLGSVPTSSCPKFTTDLGAFASPAATEASNTPIGAVESLPCTHDASRDDIVISDPTSTSTATSDAKRLHAAEVAIDRVRTAWVDARRWSLTEPPASTHPSSLADVISRVGREWMRARSFLAAEEGDSFGRSPCRPHHHLQPAANHGSPAEVLDALQPLHLRSPEYQPVAANRFTPQHQHAPIASAVQPPTVDDVLKTATPSINLTPRQLFPHPTPSLSIASILPSIHFLP